MNKTERKREERRFWNTDSYFWEKERDKLKNNSATASRDAKEYVTLNWKWNTKREIERQKEKRTERHWSKGRQRETRRRKEKYRWKQSEKDTKKINETKRKRKGKRQRGRKKERKRERQKEQGEHEDVSQERATDTWMLQRYFKHATMPLQTVCSPMLRTRPPKCKTKMYAKEPAATEEKSL